MHLIYPACICALAANDVDTAFRVATDDTSFRSCEPGRFTAGHWGRLIATQSLYRYRGEGKRARAFVREQWRGLASSQFLRVHLMRVFSEFERALSLVAALDEGETASDARREAERSVRRVLRDRPRYARADGLPSPPVAWPPRTAIARERWPPSNARHPGSRRWIWVTWRCARGKTLRGVTRRRLGPRAEQKVPRRVQRVGRGRPQCLPDDERPRFSRARWRLSCGRQENSPSAWW